MKLFLSLSDSKCWSKFDFEILRWVHSWTIDEQQILNTTSYRKIRFQNKHSENLKNNSKKCSFEFELWNLIVDEENSPQTFSDIHHFVVDQLTFY